MLTRKNLKARALEKAAVKAEHKKLEEEFALLDRCLKAKVRCNNPVAE